MAGEKLSLGQEVYAQIDDYIKTKRNRISPSTNAAGMSDQQAAKYLDQLSDYIINRIRCNKNVKINDIDLKLDKFKFKE